MLENFKCALCKCCSKMVYSVNSMKIIRIGKKYVTYMEQRRRRWYWWWRWRLWRVSLVDLFSIYASRIIILLIIKWHFFSFFWIYCCWAQTNTQCVQMRILYLSMRISIFSIRCLCCCFICTFIWLSLGVWLCFSFECFYWISMPCVQ